MTDISALEAYAGEFSESVARSKAASQQQHDYVNGTPHTDVLTESGPVPCIAKQSRLYLETLPNAAADLSQLVAEGHTYTTVTEGIQKTDDGRQFWVAQTAPLDGRDLYRRTGTTAHWEGVSQAGGAELAALRSTVEALELRKRPFSPISGDARLIFGIGGVLAAVPIQSRRPFGPDARHGAFMTMGDSVFTGMESRKRPFTEAYPDDVLLLQGESVMLRSSTSSAAAVSGDSYDAKLIQQQNQKPEAKRLAAINEGQVWAYDPLGAKQLTTVGTWLAAREVGFDIVKALKSTQQGVQPHSITQDGRIFRDGGVLYHKLATGQSLALGSRGIILDANGQFVIAGKNGRLLSTYTPVGYTNKLWTLAGGPRPVAWADSAAFEPAREYVDVLLGETPGTSWMLSTSAWHERNTSISPQLLYSISAQGGTAYSGLKKGTQVYTNLLSQVITAKRIATSMGLDYVVPSISIVHGESQTGTTQAEYVAILAEWIRNLQSDIIAITGQAVAPIAFISQMLTGEAGTIPAIPMAQLQAHNENPSIVLIGPKYDKPYFDTYHMTGDGYVKMGELEARAERLTMLSGKWQPLKVVSATVSGATITLRLNNLPNGNAATPGPVGRLAIDSTLVSDPGNAGFQLSAGAIMSVALGEDGASIEITAAAAVAPGTTLTYALQPALASPQTGAGRRGCIRDTDMRDFSRLDNKPVYNWLCAVSLELQ